METSADHFRERYNALRKKFILKHKKLQKIQNELTHLRGELHHCAYALNSLGERCDINKLPGIATMHKKSGVSRILRVFHDHPKKHFTVRSLRETMIANDIAIPKYHLGTALHTLWMTRRIIRLPKKQNGCYAYIAA